MPDVRPGADRHVLSFRPRRGRMTSGQRAAIETLWPAYAVEVGRERLDPKVVFGRAAPLVFEIGFGMGEATAAMALADPGRDVLAVDVHTPGAGALLSRLAAESIGNVRVALGDAIDVLTDMVGPATLDEIRVFFPDPWPKAKHHKRRLIGPHFLPLAASRLRAGGRLRLATDSTAYAAQMLEAINAEPGLDNQSAGYAPRPDDRPVTRFERIGLARGHRVYDIVARCPR